jgi:hypothetical protein
MAFAINTIAIFLPDQFASTLHCEQAGKTVSHHLLILRGSSFNTAEEFQPIQPARHLKKNRQSPYDCLLDQRRAWDRLRTTASMRSISSQVL